MTRGLGERLRRAGVNYLDQSGNVYLQIDGATIWLDGRPPLPAPSPSSELRSAGHRVLGAALETPTLFRQPLREIAALCGVSTSPVLGVRALLEREGHLVEARGGPRVIRRRRLLERWLPGYRDLLRPRLVIGRYALPGSAEGLGRALDRTLEGRWAWGGSQAALRRYSLGTTGDCVIHIKVLRRRDAPPLPLRADPEGAVEALALPFESAWGEVLRGAVGPLLQLAELSARWDDRSREVAASLREHLEHHWGAADG